MLFVGVSSLFLFQAVGGQRGQKGGVLRTEPNHLYIHHKKHHTVIASVSEPRDDSRRDGKAKYDL